MVESIVDDQKRIFPVCARLNGEYGINDLYIGVPVKLGKNGIEEVIELNLNQKEYNLLHESANQVRALVTVFDNMNVAGSDDRG